MNCQNYQNALEDLLDGTPTAAMEVELQRHLDNCADCRERLVQERRFRQALAEMPAPSMRAEFPAEVLAKVRQANHAEIRRHSFATGFGSAIAAGFALWLVFSVMLPGQGSKDITLETVKLGLGEVQQVNLVFDSPEELGQTTFALILPQGAELDGYPGKHEFTWKATLRKGKNRLALPIRGAMSGQGEIIARISQDKSMKTFRLKLDVTGRDQGATKRSPLPTGDSVTAGMV